VIGTVNEGPLHAQLKSWYRNPGDLLEHPVDGYVIDLVRGDLLVEIQTGGFAPLRPKLERLLDQHRVRLVAPVALTRRIVRLSPAGEMLSARRSPRHGRPQDVFSRLVSLPGLLAHPRFELELLLTHENEQRRHEPARARRRHGWIVSGRSLVSIERSLLLQTADQAAALLPDLPDPFDTAELAAAAGCNRRLAQQMTYCLRAMGALEANGHRRRAILYRRAPAVAASSPNGMTHTGGTNSMSPQRRDSAATADVTVAGTDHPEKLRG
jgi:hypothetical protein